MKGRLLGQVFCHYCEFVTYSCVNDYWPIPIIGKTADFCQYRLWPIIGASLVPISVRFWME